MGQPEHRLVERDAINSGSVVHVAICEGRQEELVGDVLDSIDRFRGAAPMFVKNVHPHNDNGGGVEFYIEIDWGSPLTVVTDITVLDPPEQGFVVN